MQMAGGLCWVITWILLFVLDCISIQIQYTSLSSIPGAYMNIFFSVVVTVMRVIFNVVIDFLTDKESFCLESRKNVSYS